MRAARSLKRPNADLEELRDILVDVLATPTAHTSSPPSPDCNMNNIVSHPLVDSRLLVGYKHGESARMSMIHCKIAPISSLTRRSDLGG